MVFCHPPSSPGKGHIPDEVRKGKFPVFSKWGEFVKLHKKTPVFDPIVPSNRKIL
jgi:hypothetical protein